uniref:At2g35280-like TPR domain-containing protein n=1 Tax=Solanum tuberosum TaxID=4113 RepID=M1DHA0_SOLTU
MGRKKTSSKMTRSKNYIESLLSSKVLNQVANEPYVYQKVTLVEFPDYIWPLNRWSVVQKSTSFLDMCKASENLEALYRKNMFDYFNHNDPNTLGIINQAADGGHIGASYALDIISIFKGGESMREGLMFIANMKKMETLKLRRCRQKLRYFLGGMWVSEHHLLYCSST